MKIDWKAKLSSRKFWAAITAVVIALLAFFNVPEMTQQQVTSLLSAVGTLVIYVLGESVVDAARNRNRNVNASNKEDTNE